MVTDEQGQTEAFDDIIFACDAETVLRVLGRASSFLERAVLGNVTYFDDVTLTHTDLAYMQQHYDYKPERRDQYFIRTDPLHPELLEMSFDLNHYQPQLNPAAPLQQHVFQTIFLDKRQQETWTLPGIDRSKVVLTKWWRQFAHTWKHFAFTVPFVQFLQGCHNTWYAGAYTLFNTHEIASISGLAAAYRLGAPYPFADDELALHQFQTYLTVAHGGKWLPFVQRVWKSAVGLAVAGFVCGGAYLLI